MTGRKSQFQFEKLIRPYQSHRDCLPSAQRLRRSAVLRRYPGNVPSILPTLKAVALVLPQRLRFKLPLTNRQLIRDPQNPGMRREGRIDTRIGGELKVLSVSRFQISWFFFSTTLFHSALRPYLCSPAPSDVRSIFFNAYSSLKPV